jgi:hypothetical protein
VFDRASRYAGLPVATLTVPGANGRPRLVTYVRRRLLPPAGAGVTLAEHVVGQGERVDTLTARYLGDPTQSWRVCDANGVLRPREVTAEAGVTVAIPLPGALP